TQRTRGGSVEALKRRRAPRTVVDPALSSEGSREPSAVHASSPREVPGGVVLLRPLSLQQRFRSPVTHLLPPVRTYGVAAKVPDHRGGVEAERPSALLQSPADVDVVPRCAKLDVESADRLEARLAEGHVASGNVLGFPVGDEDVQGAARRVGNALRDVA